MQILNDSERPQLHAILLEPPRFALLANLANTHKSGDLAFNQILSLVCTEPGRFSAGPGLGSQSIQEK